MVEQKHRLIEVKTPQDPRAKEQKKIERAQARYRRAFEAYCGMSFPDIEVMEAKRNITLGVTSGFSEEGADGPIPIPSQLAAFIKEVVLGNVPTVGIYGKGATFTPHCASVTFAVASHSPKLTYDPEGEYYLVQEREGEDPILIHDTLYIDIDGSSCSTSLDDDFKEYKISANILDALVQLFNSVVVRENCWLEEIPLEPIE